MMAPAPAVDKWGADGFKTKLPPPAGVLTGESKILPYQEANGPEKARVKRDNKMRSSEN